MPKEFKIGWKYKVLHKEISNLGLYYLYQEFGIESIGLQDQIWYVLFKKGSPKELVGKTFRVYVRCSPFGNQYFLLNEE